MAISHGAIAYLSNLNNYMLADMAIYASVGIAFGFFVFLIPILFQTVVKSENDV